MGDVECTGVDGVGVLVGDLNAELLLDGHDDLNGVKRVETEVVGEVGGGLDLLYMLGEYSRDMISETYVGDIVDLRMTLASSSSPYIIESAIGGGNSFLPSSSAPQSLPSDVAHLVKTLQQADNSALNLALVERTAGAVEPHGLEALDLGDGNGSGAGRHGEGAHGRSGGDADGSEDSGSEHCENRFYFFCIKSAVWLS